MTNEETKIFDNSEQIFNWTYPGATLYYKDCEMDGRIVDQFKTNQLIRNGYFLDVSWKGAGMKFNTRFLVASSKAAKLYEINPAVAKYGHCCINCNSYFKVIDMHTIGDKTQIFLLHIPARGLEYFARVSSNIDEDFTRRARLGFEEKLNMQPDPDLADASWVERTNFPVGMDAKNRFYPLGEWTPIPKTGEPLYSGIRSLTKDTSDINKYPD
jgi:hypothetical protein